MRLLSVALAFGLLTAQAAAVGVEAQEHGGGSVQVNGEKVPNAQRGRHRNGSVEFRSGQDDTIRLIPGRMKYRVYVISPAFVPAIESACAPGAQSPYVDVSVEDGRSFTRCLVESSSTVNRPGFRGTRRETRYCLRCEAAN